VKTAYQQFGSGVQETLGGRFQVEREVGRGAAGIVYRAYDLTSHRYVALKVINTHGAIAEEAHRFQREGQVLAELNNPGIVSVVAYGTFDDETPYLAMEWLEGEDIAARQRRKRLTILESLEIAKQIALALGAAHAAGVVHRDIKPTNVFLLEGTTGDLSVKLVDFGVASTGDVRLTREGNMVGTPAYMAPEQARGDGVVDARADLYCLGATLFEMITGRPPHVGPTAIATLARLVTTPAPRLMEIIPDVPNNLDDLVASLLATDPDDRPHTAQEVALALEDILQDPEARRTIEPQSSDAPASRSISSGSRLVTSIVALTTGTPEQRMRSIDYLREHGADAVPLGKDGLVAHLGAKQSLGDEAARALELGKYLADAGGKVGVATGRTRVHHSRPVGEVVDRASAFAREAQAEQLLADATTSELARGRYDFQQRGDGSSIVGAIRKARPKDVTGGAPFVGREAELAQMINAYERCVEDRNPVVVSCTGPPGIGKTRLGREVLARITAMSAQTRVIVVRCESFRQSHPLGTAAEVMRSLIGIPKGASIVAAALAIDYRLGNTVRSTANPGRDRIAQLISDQLPLDDQGARDSLWLAMTDLMIRMAQLRPVALVVEDGQWADPESIAWLDHVLGRATGHPIWILFLNRPNFWKQYPKVLQGKDHVRLDLRPISRKACRAIAKALLGERGDDSTIELIANQAGGSPLFAEELSRLSASGRDATKAPTIETAIQTSLDALELPLRDAIGRMSCFGLTGWEPGLEALGVPAAGEILRQLAVSELVIEHAESRFEHLREWAFKHALVREAAYASLAQEDKVTLHGYAAQWLEKMGEDAATVARHYELGNKHEEAAVHWEHAAKRALATNGLTDALTMAERSLVFADDRETAFRRALILDEAYARQDARSADRETSIRALAENIYDEASEVRAGGARARYDDARGAGEHIAERLAEVRTRAADLSLTDEEARCSAALAARFAFAGRLSEAEQEASHLLSLAEQKGVAVAAVDAWQTLAIVRQTRGELTSALDARRAAARAASNALLKEREATLTINVGFALSTIGARQESRNAIEQGLTIAQSIGSEGTIRHGKMVLLCWSATFGGSDHNLDPVLSEVRASADEAGQSPWLIPDRETLGLLFYRGMEMLRNNNPEHTQRARTLLRMAAESYRNTGMRDILPVALGLWAEAERRCSDPKRAVELAAEAADLLEAGAPSLLNEAPVYLALHDAYVENGDLMEARKAIDRAMPALVRRLAGLGRSNYGYAFLTHLPQNAALLATAEAYGVVPRAVELVLERGTSLVHKKTKDETVVSSLAKIGKLSLIRDSK
jgi:eukaryotic-like serine/threonine-protein kinase